MPMADSVVAASPRCVACAFGEGLVLLDLEDNAYFRLNAVGALVWRALAPPEGDPTSLDDLVLRVTDAFDVEEARCRADVRALVETLAERGLVHVSPARQAAPARPVSSA